ESIALLFQKHEAKKVASCDLPIPPVDEGSSVPAVVDAPIDEDTIYIVI
ncbi:Os06g0588450, partial [Oryza sativa Japonica Group]